MTDEYTQTLNDLLAIKAAEWSEEDLTAITEAFRTQRERFNAEQAVGSRRLVKAASIPTNRPLQGTMKQALKGIKL